jgi:hypothetical protein
VLEALEILLAAYERGLLGGTIHEVFPEVSASSVERRLYFTLAPSLNYQRKSEGLWQAALATYNDPATRFVFFPENIDRGLEAFRAALTRYRLAIQPARQSDIWFRICSTLLDFGGDPQVLFESCDYDINEIRLLVQGRKQDFPYLNGPKLLNYWLYMMSTFTDVPLRNRDAISIVPDVHVRRATAVLGVVSEEESRSAEAVADAWYNVLHSTGYSPVDLHAPLWRWSRQGFTPIAELAGRL